MLLNRTIKITRLEYIYKEENRPIFYLNTLSSDIKLVISKWENKF